MAIFRPSLRQIVRTEIRRRIIRGVLPAGSRINETALAQEFGTSQTPVREALLGLERDGVLNSEPRKGFFVAPLSVREVEETYPVLGKLEGFALRQIQDFPQDRIDDLRRINEEFAQFRRDADRAIDLDQEWHNAVLADCPNSLLLRMIGSLRDSISRYDFAYGQGVGNLEHSVRQHGQIVDLLEKGKVERAALLLEENWTDNIDLLVRWLRSLP